MESFLRPNNECATLRDNDTSQDNVGIQGNMTPGYVVGILAIIGIIAVLLGKLFMLSRRAMSNKTGLDTDFDAGGNVSAGLTATTIVSQWTWAATLLQSSAVAAKYGISGPFWYASGATIQILLFAMISVQLKIRAPGAKTFLQVIRARFGKNTHIVFCVFALMTNVLVTAMLMLGGAAVLTNLAPGLSVELACGLIAVVIGSYTFIGGLGATFYVSYFNTTVMFIIMILFLVKIYHDPHNADNPLGSPSRVFNLITCSLGPQGNRERSFLTMASSPGLMFGIINIVGNFGTVFADQSYWQSSVAAKPIQGVWGFLVGGVVWFAMPFTFATTMGLAYIALSADSGEALLTTQQVNEGLVVPIVAQRVMGIGGEVLIVIMVLMAVLSTGSAEVIAVTSILVYDIYMLYFKPLRKGQHDLTTCVLCGKARGSKGVEGNDRCRCVPVAKCQWCQVDDMARADSKEVLKPLFECSVHGKFRSYEEYLTSLKNWGLLWTTLSIVPLTLILQALNLSLGWVYLFMGVLIGSAVVPSILCMFWSRLNAVGMMSGAIGGAVIGFIVWLIVASRQPGGLSNFFESTGAEISMLCGNLCAILCGGLLTIVVSFVTNRSYKPSDKIDEWEKTRDIDNPLNPWTELYSREFDFEETDELSNRPPLEDVFKKFRSARFIAYGGAISLTVILIIIWPSAAYSLGVFSYNQFKHWLNISQAWGFISAAVIIVMPVVAEGMDVYKGRRERLKSTSKDTVHKEVENVTSQQRTVNGTSSYINSTSSYVNKSYVKDGGDSFSTTSQSTTDL